MIEAKVIIIYLSTNLLAEEGNWSIWQRKSIWRSTEGKGLNHLNSLAAVIDVEMSLEMKRSQSSQITGEKQREEPLFELFEPGLASDGWQAATWRNLCLPRSTLFGGRLFSQNKVFQHCRLPAPLGLADTNKSEFSCTRGHNFSVVFAQGARPCCPAPLGGLCWDPWDAPGCWAAADAAALRRTKPHRQVSGLWF